MDERGGRCSIFSRRRISDDVSSRPTRACSVVPTRDCWDGAPLSPGGGPARGPSCWLSAKWSRATSGLWISLYSAVASLPAYFLRSQEGQVYGRGRKRTATAHRRILLPPGGPTLSGELDVATCRHRSQKERTRMLLKKLCDVVDVVCPMIQVESGRGRFSGNLRRGGEGWLSHRESRSSSRPLTHAWRAPRL